MPAAEPFLISKINALQDFRQIDNNLLPDLAAEIREFLIKQVQSTGGHLGSNLGVVELTMAVHRVFDSPKDVIIFDTGHQSYVHKILTGRWKQFATLRSAGGLSGYPSRKESEHDVLESSHASSSISWADGIATGFAATGQDHRYIVVIIGDGALTGGMTWEALNNIAARNNRKIIIIINDNGRSYAPTVGGIAMQLAKLRTTSGYIKMQTTSARFLTALFGTAGSAFHRGIIGGLRGFLSSTFGTASLYPNLNIKYLGPVDGHDTNKLIKTFQMAKKYNMPVLVHAITQKGKGYQDAILETKDHMHSIGANAATDDSRTWTEVFSSEIIKIHQKMLQHAPFDNSSSKTERSKKPYTILAICAAMLEPVGLGAFAKIWPKHIIDVGIAEQHAVALAAGIALTGVKPIVAIYSTFLHRAFDNILMDVALHKAPVTFIVDRAGITGEDGPSHHGIWDIALFLKVPGIFLAAPRDAVRLKSLLALCVGIETAPSAIRFPKGRVPGDIPPVGYLNRKGAVFCRDKEKTEGEREESAYLPHILYHFTLGVQSVERDVSFAKSENEKTSENSKEKDKKVLIISIGSMASIALEIAHLLEAEGFLCVVVDPLLVSPIPLEVIEFAKNFNLFITLEDGVKTGGAGSFFRDRILENRSKSAYFHVAGIETDFIPHGARPVLLKKAGLDAEMIVRKFKADFAQFASL